MEKSILITSTDAKVLQRIISYISNTTNHTTTTIETIDDLIPPETRNAEGPSTSGQNNANNPPVAVRYINGRPVNVMDENVRRRIPIVERHGIPFEVKIEDDEDEISEEQNVMNNIEPPVNTNSHEMEDIDREEVDPTIDESNDRSDDLESSEEQRVLDDIEQPIEEDVVVAPTTINNTVEQSPSSSNTVQPLIVVESQQTDSDPSPAAQSINNLSIEESTSPVVEQQVVAIQAVSTGEDDKNCEEHDTDNDVSHEMEDINQNDNARLMEVTRIVQQEFANITLSTDEDSSGEAEEVDMDDDTQVDGNPLIISVGNIEEVATDRADNNVESGHINRVGAQSESSESDFSSQSDEESDSSDEETSSAQSTINSPIEVSTSPVVDQQFVAKQAVSTGESSNNCEEQDEDNDTEHSIDDVSYEMEDSNDSIQMIEIDENQDDNNLNIIEDVGTDNAQNQGDNNPERVSSSNNHNSVDRNYSEILLDLRDIIPELRKITLVDTEDQLGRSGANQNDNADNIEDDQAQSDASNNHIDQSSYQMFECKKCAKLVDLSNDMKRKAESHVYWHTDWSKYRCLMSECGKKFDSIDTAEIHRKEVHGGYRLRIKEIEWKRWCMNAKKSANLKELVMDCFPDAYFEAYNLKQCRDCLEEVVDYVDCLLEHGLRHARLPMYKCTWNKCLFLTIYANAFKNHSKYVHKVRSNDLIPWMIDLSGRQKRDIIERCFPDTSNVVQNSIAQKSSSTADSIPLIHINDSDNEETMIKKEYITCKKCLQVIDKDTEAAQYHGTFCEHISSYRYKCSVDQCDRRSNYVSIMMRHHAKRHIEIPFDLKLTDWSDENCQEYRQAMKECFPDMEITGNICQLCNQFIGVNKDTHYEYHLSFKRYKCNECPFASSSSFVMKCHGIHEHEKVLDTNALKIELTKEQVAEMWQVFKECFLEE